MDILSNSDVIASTVDYIYCSDMMKNFLKINKFNYIIADYYLGESETGLDFITEVQQFDKERRHKSNIILMSARFEPHIIKEAISMEINNLLVKPFTLEKLRSLISED